MGNKDGKGVGCYFNFSFVFEKVNLHLKSYLNARKESVILAGSSGISKEKCLTKENECSHHI